MRNDATNEIFEMVTVLGRPMLFTNNRIDRATVPDGMYLYEVRHDDYGRGEPCEIAKGILVNHWGTLITNRPIKLLAGNAYRVIDAEKDWNYNGTETTLNEYMKKYPVQKRKQQDRDDAR
ncbi:MAG: hypothetical protein HFF09_07930 [Oscillospiraceae bacterium]|nr:hypothetical protein [Oscillospiraceae bacterium]